MAIYLFVLTVRNVSVSQPLSKTVPKRNAFCPRRSGKLLILSNVQVVDAHSVPVGLF